MTCTPTAEPLVGADGVRPHSTTADAIRLNAVQPDQVRSTSLRPVSVIPGIETLDFRLPPDLEASDPPEARGLARDQVRLMVSYRRDGAIIHTQFRRLPDFLDAGDVLVINTSGTLNAALQVCRDDGAPLELHLSTHLPSGLFSVELRRPTPEGSQPFYTACPGETLVLSAGGTATLHEPYPPTRLDSPSQGSRVRLWLASLQLPLPLLDYLERYGFPIRYKYVRDPWPNSYYQTVYVTEMGSAEMPSAGRAFTPELITRLVARGVHLAPLILHTGVASLEEHEPPYAEYYRVPEETARVVNAARTAGKRVIAVGTTVVRALETVAGADGLVASGEGWTHHVVTPQNGVRSLDGLLTGLHEPRSTHLAMLAAICGGAARDGALDGIDHLRRAYSEAIEHGYLWHEFGDLHLILP